MSSSFVRNGDGRVAYGALNGKKAAHFTSPYKTKYNDNPSPDKYKPVLSQTKPRPTSAFAKRDADKRKGNNNHHDIWENQQKVSDQNPQVGQYAFGSTFEYSAGNKSVAGALNLKKSAHFVSPYETKYNDNPSPDKYNPD